ncbi:NUDIX hydrolase [Streptomyces sp. NPDC093109]|uniref:NUDIX hydrolase n=1 Tax=Streptomyces sp. NPDC093109 TaxID=3154977 RepID=UPI00344DC9F7
MSVDDSAIAREINRYLHLHPDETLTLMPLFDVMLSHSRLRHCSHEERCPQVRVGAVLVDEQERTLALWHGRQWGFIEDSPSQEDTSLGQTAIRVLKENYGVYDVWTPPGIEGPLLIEVAEAEQGSRLRFGFRYLFYAHSGAVLPSMEQTGQVRWLRLDELGSPLLHERMRAQLAAVM